MICIACTGRCRPGSSCVLTRVCRPRTCGCSKCWTRIDRYACIAHTASGNTSCTHPSRQGCTCSCSRCGSRIPVCACTARMCQRGAGSISPVTRSFRVCTCRSNNAHSHIARRARTARIRPGSNEHATRSLGIHICSCNIRLTDTPSPLCTVRIPEREPESISPWTASSYTRTFF